MLPPLMITPTLPSTETFELSKAAIPKAPDGSTTSFNLKKRKGGVCSCYF